MLLITRTHMCIFMLGVLGLAASSVMAQEGETGKLAVCRSSSGTCRVLESVDPGLRGERLRRVKVELPDWNEKAGTISVDFPSGASTQWEIQSLENMPQENCTSECVSDGSIKCATPNVDVGSHFCGGTTHNIMCTWICPGFGLFSVELQCP